MIKTCLKMVLGLITCHQSVSGALIISPLGRTWKQNSVSHCNAAQVKHHEQVVVGGHLAALASSGEVNFIEKFSEIINIIWAGRNWEKLHSWSRAATFPSCRPDRVRN